MNIKNIIIGIVSLVVIVGAYFLITKEAKNQPVIYSNEVFTFVSGNNEFTIKYDTTGKNAKLNLSGLEHDLKVARSASGAKYESLDGRVVFWEHQGEAILEIDGIKIIENARVKNDSEEIKVDSEVKDIILKGTSWLWKQTEYSNDDVVKPNKPEAFVLTFNEEKAFSSTTDCNNIFGIYEVNDSNISFGQIASTMMACPDIEPQETLFANMLDQAKSYLIIENGNLALTLKNNLGSIIFTPVIKQD